MAKDLVTESRCSIIIESKFYNIKIAYQLQFVMKLKCLPPKTISCLHFFMASIYEDLNIRSTTTVPFFVSNQADRP